MVDGVNGFGTAFDGKDKTLLLQFLLQRRNERRHVRFPFCFFGIQRVRDIFIGVIVKKLQRQVLHLGLDLIQTQTVCHRSMKRLRLFGDVPPTIRVSFLIELPHQFQALVEY